MAERETILLDVVFNGEQVANDLRNVSSQAKALRNQAADLRKEIKNNNDDNGEMSKRLVEVRTKLSDVEKEQKALLAATRLLTDEGNTYADSLDGQRRKLNDMQRAFDNMSKAQRESAEGKEFLQALQEQDAAVKELEQDTGRFQRNVGNYPSAFKGAVPFFNQIEGLLGKMGTSLDGVAAQGGKAFKSMGASAKAFGKTLITPPVGVVVAILSAILLVVNKLSEAFKKNDDAATNLSKAFAVFQPVITAINTVIDKLALGISKVIVGLSELSTTLLGKIIPAYAKAATAAAELVVAQDDLEESERQYTVNAAQRAKEVSRLRAEAAETTDLEERKKLIQQAIKLEQEDLEERKNIAAEKLRIAEETAKQEVDTSDDTKNKIAQLKAAQLAAEQAYYDGVRRLSKEIVTIEKQQQADRIKAAEEYKAKILALRKEEFEEAEKNREIALILQEYWDNVARKEEEATQRALQALEALPDIMEEEEETDDSVILSPEEMAAQLGLDSEGLAYFKELVADGADFFTAKQTAIADMHKRKTQEMAKSLGVLSGGFGDMADALAEYGEENKAAAAASKAFALGNILASQAQSIAEGALAISEGIESASSVPFPANIAAIATVVGTITGLIASTVSSFKQAKQLLSQDSGKFASGGFIGGNSYSGDRMIAHVNSGEAVLTTAQQRNFMELANGGAAAFDYGALADVMVAAVAAQPAPVLDYTEFADFDSKRITYNEIAQI